MSTENINPEVGQQEEPVLVLDDKKYVISELSDEAKYIVACLNSLTQKRTNLQMELDQVQVASQGFTDRLKEAVENPPEEENAE
jgi:intracellular sulfur oxidation DsrE/DsrF family protein